MNFRFDESRASTLRALFAGVAVCALVGTSALAQPAPTEGGGAAQQDKGARPKQAPKAGENAAPPARQAPGAGPSGAPGGGPSGEPGGGARKPATTPPPPGVERKMSPQPQGEPKMAPRGEPSRMEPRSMPPGAGSPKTDMEPKTNMAPKTDMAPKPVTPPTPPPGATRGTQPDGTPGPGARPKGPLTTTAPKTNAAPEMAPATTAPRMPPPAQKGGGGASAMPQGGMQGGPGTVPQGGMQAPSAMPPAGGGTMPQRGGATMPPPDAGRTLSQPTPMAPAGPGGPKPGVMPSGPIALPPPVATTPLPARTGLPRQTLDQLRGERRETLEGGRTVFRETDRVIIRDPGGQSFVRHNELGRFRYGARDIQVREEGGLTRTVIVRPDGTQIINITAPDGRLIRRIRRDSFGREIIIIDAGMRPPGAGFFLPMGPPPIRIPRERYIVDFDGAPPEMIYETLMAEPVERLDRGYSLDEVRYNANLRARMPSIDLNTITFGSGSWDVEPSEANKLTVIANGIKRALERSPSEVFLIEGHTDAVGSEVDNLSLSDRRAESVALVLTEQFGVPAENLVTQGYGEQNLKEQTSGESRINRRVTVRRITPLLAGGPPQR